MNLRGCEKYLRDCLVDVATLDSRFTIGYMAKCATGGCGLWLVDVVSCCRVGRCILWYHFVSLLDSFYECNWTECCGFKIRLQRRHSAGKSRMPNRKCQNFYSISIAISFLDKKTFIAWIMDSASDHANTQSSSVEKCTGCRLTQRQFYSLSDEQFTDFLIRHGAIPRSSSCSKCKRILRPTIHHNTRIFRCSNVYRPLKKKPRQCNFSVSVYKNTFFSYARLPLLDVAELVYCYVTMLPPRLEFISKTTSISRTTLIDYFSTIRKIFDFWAEKTSEPLGGEGITVEIEEAENGKRMDSEDQWFLGGIERGSKRFFLVPLRDRAAETLAEIIKTNIRPGTTVISHWKAHERLDQDICNQLTTSHSLKFLDFVTTGQIKDVKRYWAEVRKSIPRTRKRNCYAGYMSEGIFKTVYENHLERMHHFWLAAGELYPPL